MRISDWSSDVCSSDLVGIELDQTALRRAYIVWRHHEQGIGARARRELGQDDRLGMRLRARGRHDGNPLVNDIDRALDQLVALIERQRGRFRRRAVDDDAMRSVAHLKLRSEEHTSELQSLMRISYAVFCLKKKKT